MQINPGEEWKVTNPQTASFTPVSYNANHELLHEMAAIIGEQIDTAALPRNTFSGPQFKLSGFAVEKYIQGIQSRVDFLKRAPERALGVHYKLRLHILKTFATSEMARTLSKDDKDLYLSSFSVSGFTAKVEGQKAERRMIEIGADDVPEHCVVHVDISPNVPADEENRIQRAQAMLGMGVSFEDVIKKVYKADDADEMILHHDVMELAQRDPMFGEFYGFYKQTQVFKRDRDMRKEWDKWIKAEGLVREQQIEDGTEATPPPVGMEALSLQSKAQEDALAQGEGGQAPQMQPADMMMGAGGGAPPMDPSLMMGGQMPNQLMASALQGMQG